MIDSTPSSARASRRQFLQQVGGAPALIALIVTGCDSNGRMSEEKPETVTLDFSDVFGVLNYACALEQLEPAFYAEAAANGHEAEDCRVPLGRVLAVRQGVSAKRGPLSQHKYEHNEHDMPLITFYSH